MSLLNEDNIYEETRKATRPPMTYTAFKNLLSIVKKTPKSTQKKINIEKYIDTNKSDGITINNKGDISFHGKKGLELAKKLKEENLPTTNIFKQRENKNMGGLLQDERLRYASGPKEEEIESMEVRSHLSRPELMGPERTSYLENAPKDSPQYKESFNYGVVELGMSPDSLEFEINKLRNEDDSRITEADGGPTHIMPDGTEMPGATHEEYEQMMDESVSLPEEQEQDIIPDNEMEDNYLDFILDEALDEEEEDYLMEMLQGNNRLSEIFDKVVGVAQEFAGSGPVEGPGSGVSDSIPARLSDGEFVFTAKAVDEIGADNLMAMMEDAEMKADDRQGLAKGGKPEEERVVLPVEEQKEPQVRIVKETVDSSKKSLTDEDEISAAVKQKLLLDNLRGRHVQS